LSTSRDIFTLSTPTSPKSTELVTESAIQQLIFTDKTISAKAVEKLVEDHRNLPLITEVSIADIDLKDYDELLSSDNCGGIDCG